MRNERSATRAERLAERIAENVATASIRVPPAVARDEIVCQSVTSATYSAGRAEGTCPLALGAGVTLGQNGRGRVTQPTSTRPNRRCPPLAALLSKIVAPIHIHLLVPARPRRVPSIQRHPGYARSQRTRRLADSTRLSRPLESTFRIGRRGALSGSDGGCVWRRWSRTNQHDSVRRRPRSYPRR
jgi:hypothetical protein